MLGRETAELKVLTGTMLSELIAQRGRLRDIREAEFKVFSQFGEDGIIQYLVRQMGIPTAARNFVEFGVESYEESNTRFLLMKDSWRGLIIDGSDANMRIVRESSLYWRQNLTAVTAFIDRDNINGLIREGGFYGRDRHPVGRCRRQRLLGVGAHRRGRSDHCDLRVQQRVWTRSRRECSLRSRLRAF
jgi:hypothetical protein